MYRYTRRTTTSQGRPAPPRPGGEPASPGGRPAWSALPGGEPPPPGGKPAWSALPDGKPAPPAPPGDKSAPPALPGGRPVPAPRPDGRPTPPAPPRPGGEPASPGGKPARAAPPHAAGARGGSQREGFRRDAPTLLCYGVAAAYAFWLYAFGPALALLRAELGFSYTLLGVYSALWSVGATLVGVSFAAIARRLRRAALLWGSAAAAIAGAALFAATHAVALTLLGSVVLAFAGTTMLTCTQAVLSDRHGERRDRALIEANVGAAACAVLAPLLLGLLQGTSAGWRTVMGLPVLVLAGLYLRGRHQPLPEAAAGRGDGGRPRLPLACWLLASLVAAGVAAEFCLVYFGAELLAATGLRTAQAATAMSGFYLGILAGRGGAAWLTRRAGRSAALLWASLAVTAAGFLLFWLAGLPVLAIAGLFACGLGIANLYPLSLSLTLAAAPGNGDIANARAQLLAGALTVAAPYLLGSLADHIGLRAAFAVVLVLIGVCAVLLPAGLRLTRRPAPEAAHDSLTC